MSEPNCCTTKFLNENLLLKNEIKNTQILMIKPVYLGLFTFLDCNV